MRIGELATAAGVSPDTLRYYERRGLLPRASRLENGYRAYGPETVRRVGVIRSGLAAGLTLDEIREVLQLRDAGAPPCRRVRDLVAVKLAEVERRLDALTATRDRMRALLVSWDTRLQVTPPGTRARLLESSSPSVVDPHPLHAPVPRRPRRSSEGGPR
jgi:DNA-binding transcriptional MerR regulator